MEKISKIAEELKAISETAKEISANGEQIIQNISSANNEMINNAPVIDENMQQNNVGLTMQQLTTSKLLMWSVVIFTGFLFILSAVVQIVWDKNISYLLSYATYITTPTILGYKAKSLVENIQKNSNTVNLPKINIKE